MWKKKEKRSEKKPYRNPRVIKFQSYVIHSEYIFIGTFETLRGNSSLTVFLTIGTHISTMHTYLT